MQKGSHITRALIIAAGVFSCVVAFGQQGRGYLLLQRDITDRFEQTLNHPDISFHTSVKPYLYSDLARWVKVDSLMPKLGFPFTKSKVLQAYNTQPGYFSIAAEPLWTTDIGFETNNGNSQGVNATALGFAVTAALGPKWHLRTNYLSGDNRQPEYLSRFSDSTDVVPGLGRARETSNGQHYKNFSGYLSFTPSRYIDLQVGHGKNFWGDGYRSLLLSDVANNYNYFKATTTIWKVKYVNLVANFKDIREIPGRNNETRDKFGTFHYLSLDITKRLNISLFEAVIWRGEDTLIDRGFDVNYLNPIIFFRPVEFSTGSADNSLIGAAFKYKATKHLQFYGQLVIDEFLLSDIRAGEGSWRNKQAFQLGLKRFNLFGAKNLWLQSEFNYVRPFIYSHSSSEQNYGHFNQALAHPLGANFWETVTFLHYHHNNWSFRARAQYALVGTDTPVRNVGQNIFQSYDNRVADFNFFTGQGTQNRLFMAGLDAAYIIYPASNLQFRVNWLYRRLSVEDIGAGSTHVFTVGLSTALSNLYRDF